MLTARLVLLTRLHCGHVLRRGIIVVYLLAALTYAAPTTVHAASYDIADGDIPALITALDAANTGDTEIIVNLAPHGMYVLTSVHNGDPTAGTANGLPVIHANMTIHGNGATLTRATDPATPPFRFFYVDQGANLHIDALTVSNGQIRNDVPVAKGSVNQVPTAPDSIGGLGFGGAIFNRGALTITGSTFTGNSAIGLSGSAGGVIYSGRGGTLMVTDSTFRQNASTDTAADGKASSTGGAIYVDGFLSVDRSAFVENHASGFGVGGAIFGNGTITVEHSVVVGNKAGSGVGIGVGGAIFSNGPFTASDTTFATNIASGVGGTGGVIFSNGPLTFINATIVGNKAGDNQGFGAGGALYTNNHNAMLINTIVVNNAASDGSNCHGITASNDGGHNLEFGPSDSCRFSDAKMDQFGDPMLDILKDNGGETQTIAPLPGSAAIGHGDPAACAAVPVSGSDQRGQPRPADVCDIGAFQTQGMGSAVLSINP